MKQKTKEIYLNDEYKCGGYYDLSIQVCPNSNIEPIKKYTNYIWNLNYIHGPLDKKYNKTKIDTNKNGFNNGILILNEYEIPFITMNICEYDGFNWFNISITATVIEKVFGNEYIVWNKNPNIPILLKEFHKHIVEELYKVFPFELGISGFEVSGEKYIEDLKTNEIKKSSSIIYYVGKNNYEHLSINNKNNIELI
jgi:hypothetical protein